MAASRGEVVIRTDENLLVLAANHTFKLAKKHPAVSLTWIAGLLLSVFATGFVPSPDNVLAYERELQKADAYTNDLLQAQDECQVRQAEHYASKGWFFQCDAVCQLNKAAAREACGEYRTLEQQYNRDVARAKSNLGVFSTAGVAEARQLFMKKAAGGQAYARRATFYDAIFAGIGAMGRDTSLPEYIFAVLFHLIRNVTFGAIGCLATFLWGVWSVITSYEASPLTAAGFYACAAVAAVSVVATFFLAMAATGVGAVAGMVSIAKANGALEGPAAQQRLHSMQQQQQYQQQQYRRGPHQD